MSFDNLLSSMKNTTKFNIFCIIYFDKIDCFREFKSIPKYLVHISHETGNMDYFTSMVFPKHSTNMPDI